MRSRAAPCAKRPFNEAGALRTAEADLEIGGPGRRGRGRREDEDASPPLQRQNRTDLKIGATLRTKRNPGRLKPRRYTKKEKADPTLREG